MSASVCSEPFDLLIIGAGPAGLCLARALSGHGMRIGLVDQAPEDALAQPADDGREIGLSQPSVRILRHLGIWPWLERNAPEHVAQLRDALILDGEGAHTASLRIPHTLARHTELGWLVSNHAIRRGAWLQVQASRKQHQDITLLTGQPLAQAHVDGECAHVTLADGTRLRSRLLVAADSRFSPTRRALGLAADWHDFGRSMLLCPMRLEQPHHQVAWQWFGHRQTLALLPMQPDPASGAPRASCIITLPAHEIQALAALDDAALGAAMTQRFEGRLGQMAPAGPRHIAPLVGVYARQMAGPRIVCVGDAAVGMHPVTAHGFNFGLRSVDTLSTLLRASWQAGRDPGAQDVLQRYAQAHRRTTWPLYQATTAIARLYGSGQAPTRWLRQGLLRLAEHTRPFKQAVAWSLAG